MSLVATHPSPPCPTRGDSLIGARRRPAGAAAFRLLFALLFALPGVAAGQEVGGRVLDLDGGTPVAGATVELLGADEAAGTLATVAADADGRFVLRAPQTGTYRIRASHIGHRTVTTSLFDLARGEDPLDVEVLLGVEAIPLAPLVILSERPARLDLRLHNRGFYERRRTWGRDGMGFGHFLEREDIDRRNPVAVVDLFRDIPGVRLMPTGGAGFEITMRSPTQILESGLGCSPLVFLDGVVLPLREPLDALVSVVDLAGVEVYPGIAQPAEFMRGNHCGAIALWTGDGGRARPPRARFRDGEGIFAVELGLGSGIGEYAPTASGLHWEPAFAVRLVVDARVLSRVSLYAGLSRSAFGCGRGECAGLNASFVSTGLDAGVRGELDLRGRPWARLGLVRHRLESRWFEEGAGHGSARSPSGFGFETAAGLEIPLASGLAVTPGVRFLRWTVSDERGGRFVDPFTVEDPLRILVLGVGVRRRF